MSPDGFIAGPNEDVALRIQRLSQNFIHSQLAAFQICLQY